MANGANTNLINSGCFWHEKVGRHIAVPDIFFKGSGDRIVAFWLHERRGSTHDKCEMRAGLFDTGVSNVWVVLGKSVVREGAYRETELAIRRPFVSNQTKKDSGSAR